MRAIAILRNSGISSGNKLSVSIASRGISIPDRLFKTVMAIKEQSAREIGEILGIEEQPRARDYRVYIKTVAASRPAAAK